MRADGNWITFLCVCVVAVWELFGSPLKVVDAPLMMVVVGCPRFQLRHRNALFINGTDAVDDQMILFLLKIIFVNYFH